MTDESRNEPLDASQNESPAGAGEASGSSAAVTPRYGEMKPRPQYGEYASPQDQAKAMGLSFPPISAVLLPPRAPDVAARVTAHGTGKKLRAPAAARTDSTPSMPTKPRRWDFILTSILLAYATWNVATQVFVSSDLSGVVNRFYETQGIGNYTSTDLSASLGSVLNIVTIVLFVLTVFITSRLLRNGRLAFYVPIVGGAIAITIALVFVAVIVMGDPTFLAYTAKMRN